MREHTVRGVRAVRWGLLLACALAAPASAFDFLDQRIEIHGYVEAQVRTISTDLNSHLDLTQWYSILNVEMDLNIAPDGWGPFDSIGGFVRGEVRYDCVWTRACGLSSGTNAFGNRSRVAPERLSQGKISGLTGAVQTEPPFYLQPGGKIATSRAYDPVPAPVPQTVPATPALPGVLFNYRGFNQIPRIDTLFNTRAAVNGVDYVPANYTFQRFLPYGLLLRDVRGTEDGIGVQVMPWDPKDDIDPHATLRDRVNPFRPGDVNPVTGLAGGTNLPYRPAPNFAPNQGPNTAASGIYYPSPGYRSFLMAGGSDNFQQNFSQEDLAWNRGASQSQTKELKEAYLEITMLEGSLFARLGRQTIVWGKTELFATTDLFNPSDLALASLPKLEESRIPLWAARFIYNFYDVGPLQDVRLEAAVDLDAFTPNDLGRCGEAYTPNPVCDKTFGLLAHGFSGLAVAGEARPPSLWSGTEGFQGGVRLEFRWEAFSFALVDFWNYEKLPYQDRISTYSRNVDPTTGRPRRNGATGACVTGNEPACLQGGNDALQNTSLNQQEFALICSSSVGFNALDRSVCAQSVLNSQSLGALSFAPLTQVLSQLYSGSPNGISLVANPGFVGPASRIPLVSLSIDPTDGPPQGFFAPLAQNAAFNYALPGFPANHNQFQTFAQVLTPQQQALLGCGAFYGTSCDGGANSVNNAVAPGGIDLLNAEASAVLQSWIGSDGTPMTGMLATDRSQAQPGTVGFRGGPICTRVLPNGQVVMLPGCRGPQDAGYDPAVDGANPGTQSIGFPAGFGGTPALGSGALGPIAFTQGQPFTGQTWSSEMAALSWNIEMILVAFSDRLGAPNTSAQVGFDPNNAYRTDGCSYVLPQYCSAVKAFFEIVGQQRNTRDAAGNGRFGRTDFVWAGGGEVVLRYQRRNVLGFSTDFAEDVTKTNWSTEFAWVNRAAFVNQNEFDGITKTGTYNLTISVDRPTFINFLNMSRTFFFNSQWFFQYVPGYQQGFTKNGPWETLMTFTVNTGYFQDRLLPSMTTVYDFQSNSGAVLPQIQFRFTESFSATFGLALFWGRTQDKEASLNPISLRNNAGRDAYRSFVDNGLSVVRDRDEVFMSIRYTF
jgi:hypothetical protein